MNGNASIESEYNNDISDVWHIGVISQSLDASIYDILVVTG